MAAVAISQPPLLPAAVSMASPTPLNRTSISGPTPKPKTQSTAKDVKIPRGRRERPCDACRRRKSKCVTNEGQGKTCTACGVHAQECTYLEDPQPRKRKIDNENKEVDHPKRRLVLLQTPNSKWVCLIDPVFDTDPPYRTRDEEALRKTLPPSRLK